MSPQASRRPVVTASSNMIDLEARNKRSTTSSTHCRRQSLRRRGRPPPPHRRPQDLCTTERLPALFAWSLLLSTSFSYWICILPELIDLLPSLQAVFVLHCLLFVLLCGNFLLATFMDPVSTMHSRLTVNKRYEHV
jgi:hypothetical protein